MARHAKTFASAGATDFAHAHMTGPHHETEGVLSPLIRDIRLRRISKLIPGGSRVLDLACGNGFLSRFLPEHCEYYGVDVLSPTDTSVFADFLSADLLDEAAPDRILGWLDQQPVDVVTCAAFLEHIPDPARFLASCRPLLRPEARIVGTTPHPRGRRLHDSLARLYLCSQAGAADHESFLSRQDLEQAAADAGGRMVAYHTFLWGLNQLFVFHLHS